jgi:predicted ATP-grasp superfamily ATP-dependent carboligase
MVVPRGSYLQERMDGIPGSVIFAASNHGATVLGVSRQLVGDAGFGAGGFRYCGSLIGHPSVALFPDQARLLDQATQVAAAVSQEFGLQGLNGIDFVARNGVPYPIEVNPRYSASMELVERSTRFSLFGAHLRACLGQTVESPGPITGLYGKAIVFARRHTIIGDTGAWIQLGSLADLPHSGERIRRGRPICTVFATAPGLAGCLRTLKRRAESVYRAVSLRGKRAA